MRYDPFPGYARRGSCMLAALALLSTTSAIFAQTPAAPAREPATKSAPAPAMTQSSPSPKGMDKTMPGMQGKQGTDATPVDMRESMMGMMKNMESMKMTGDTDRDFAAMMKMHHQGAIDMARLELKGGKDARMRAMAKQIIDAQQKEIKEFDQWLRAKK